QQGQKANISCKMSAKLVTENQLSVGAGEGNRTLVCSLGSCRSTIELRPRPSNFKHLAVSADRFPCHYLPRSCSPSRSTAGDFPLYHRHWITQEDRQNVQNPSPRNAAGAISDSRASRQDRPHLTEHRHAQAQSRDTARVSGGVTSLMGQFRTHALQK